jgi:hypothetical protein
MGRQAMADEVDVRAFLYLMMSLVKQAPSFLASLSCSELQINLQHEGL